MPPPLFDSMHLDRAIHGEALPALERLANNPSVRDGALRRFERDEPPRYVSSTEDEADDIPPLVPGLIDSAQRDEAIRLFDKPLDETESNHVANHMESIYGPQARYAVEAKIERRRIEKWAWSKASQDTREYFVQVGPARKGRAGDERVNIVARHNLKRRWNKLGIWNPEWGIPGNRNNALPNDNVSSWKWWWQNSDATAQWQPGPETLARNAQHPVARALHLHKGLRRGEHASVSPRCCLQGDGPASQAESFITSRPWFTYAIERSEDDERRCRLSFKQERLLKPRLKSVRELWEENGNWKAEWEDRGRQTQLVGWKWPNESPTPEPEDLAGLEDLDTFEFTHSEIDALEAVPPPSPPTPPIPYDPHRKRGPGVFGTFPPDSTLAELSDEAELAAELTSPPQQPRRRRVHQQRAADSPQPLRRSARIAAMAAKQSILAPLPHQQRATRSTPARPPAAKRPKNRRPKKVSDVAGVSKAPTRARRRQRKR